jgi:hypothetical protein
LGARVTNVGGDPSAMTGGAKDLNRSGGIVHDMGPHLRTQVTGAAGAAGEESLAGALRRFGAAWSEVATDTGTQVLAASQLAANAAADLDAAGGSGPR